MTAAASPARELVTAEQVPGLRRALSVLRAARDEHPQYSLIWEITLECCRRIAVLIDEPEEPASPSLATASEETP